MGLLWLVVVGAIAGWLAGRFMTGNGFGLISDIVIGVIGAFIGGYLFRAAGVEIGGFVGSLVVAFVGAVLLLFLIRLITGRRRGRRLWS